MKHPVAIWAGVSAFFGTILAIGAIDILNPDDRVQFLGGVVVGLITGGAVYAKQRLDDAKKVTGTIEVETVDDKKTYMLEIDGDLDALDKQSEVVFRVKHRS